MTDEQNQFIVCQSFNNLELFHETPPINKTSITQVFSSSDVAPYAARTRGLVCAIKKNQERGKHGQLDQATT
ncbi:MAG TPA: hypothetical protein VFG30_09060, partial [Polyangiales bacterium]|nr:hypothetical protein [Polyangiales bacterium]